MPSTQAATIEKSSTRIPLPPPPPPLPPYFSESNTSLGSQTSFIPPPPPVTRLGSDRTIDDAELCDVPSLSDCRAPEAINHSRVMLQKMQSRLRMKMKKKGGVSGEQEAESSRGAKSDAKVDVRVS